MQNRIVLVRVNRCFVHLITTQKHVLRAELRNVVARFEQLMHTQYQSRAHKNTLHTQTRGKDWHSNKYIFILASYSCILLSDFPLFLVYEHFTLNGAIFVGSFAFMYPAVGRTFVDLIKGTRLPYVKILILCLNGVLNERVYVYARVLGDSSFRESYMMFEYFANYHHDGPTDLG